MLLAKFVSALALPAVALLAAPDAPVAPVAPAPPSTRAIDPLPHPPQVDVLDNGLTLVTVPFDAPGIVSYFTLVKAGSRDEVEPGKSGYAHLFEHLMFRGTDTLSAREYERRMQAMGADNNAFTTGDFTLYTPTVPKEALPELVAIEAERFEHLHVQPDAYKDETGAVLGEYNKTFANPMMVMNEALRQLAFTQHTYGHTTIGLKKDVEDMPNQYEYSRAFFRRFYTPDDCVIFAVGDVRRDEILPRVKEAYKGWTGKRAETKAKPEPAQTAPRRRALTWRGATEPRLLEGFRVPATSASLRDAAALTMVAALGFSESSDLYQRLVVKEQKLLTLDADTDALSVLHRDPGLFQIEAKLKPTTSFDEVIAAVDDALASIAKGQTPPERIEAVRSHMTNAMTVGLQTTSAVARQLAAFAAVTGDVRAFEAYAKELAQVTPEDVARVAKLLVPARRSVVTMTSSEAKGKGAGAAPPKGNEKPTGNEKKGNEKKANEKGSAK